MKVEIVNGYMEGIGVRARAASQVLSVAPSKNRDLALSNIANKLVDKKSEILAANEEDRKATRESSLDEAYLGRLILSSEQIDSMAVDVNKIAALPDPVGEYLDLYTVPNGLEVGKRRVPLGVIGAIYESRPNVTIDISALCIKSGNCLILRGGKEAIRSNKILSDIVRDSLTDACLPGDSVQFVKSTDRKLVGQMLRMDKYIDLMVPRGSAELVSRVKDEATMYSITGGVGVCHIYVDQSADVDMALNIIVDSKLSRPYACNALDTLLVHSDIATRFLPKLTELLLRRGVEIRCDSIAVEILEHYKHNGVLSAKDSDWGTEFLSLIMAVKIVDSTDEAIAHIHEYGSGHSEAIVVDDHETAMKFMSEVDSGVVLVNASTVFNDGGQLGLGAEVAISTSKMHARGPLGLKELMSYKWTVFGSGQVRG